MAETSEISWTDATFNPWIGCSKVSEGCRHCYAEADFDHRKGRVKWGPQGTRSVTSEAYWKGPLKWNRECAVSNKRMRVFCASLADVFEGRDTMPHGVAHTIEAARLRLFRLIHDTPCIDWLLLTKRPQNITDSIAGAARLIDVYADDPTADMLTDWLGGKPPENVWLGTSVENQAAADERIPLLKVPAKVRFISMEPLLGEVDLSKYLRTRVDGRHVSVPSVDWVIVGGESGAGVRPLNPDWVRSLRDQCQAAGVAFHFKQWGEYAPESAGGMFSVGDKTAHTVDELGRLDVRNGGGQLHMLRRVGKKNAGRLLDGRAWNGFPTVTTQE